MKTLIRKSNSFTIFLIGFFLNWLGLLLWLAFDNIFINIVFMVFSISFYLLSFISFIFIDKLICTLPLKLKLFYSGMVFFMLFLLLIGFTVNEIISESDSFILFDLGFFAISLGTISFLSVKKEELKWIVKIYLSILIVFLLSTYDLYDFQLMITASSRNVIYNNFSKLGFSNYMPVYTLARELSQFAIIVFIVCFNYIREKPYYLVGIFAILFSFMYGVFFMKRNVFFELTILFIFLFITSNIKKKLLTIILLFLVLIFLPVLISEDIFIIAQTMLDRFNDVLSNLSSFDRLEESKIFFENYSLLDYIFGRGIGSYVPGTVGYNQLHIGLSNLVLKGGFIFCIFILIFLISGLLKSILKKNKYTFFSGTFLSFFSLLLLCYSVENWGYNPNSMLISLAILDPYLKK